uniref:Uncharacterized protein n=1 Tax=Fagus sylvatica TaxID=28930 RepID=A0A2N9F639_FAGSY
MVKSLAGSISSLFNARIQKSLPSSQVEEASGEDNKDVDVTKEESSEEEVSSEDMYEVHEERISEGCVDVGNDEFREEHNEDPIPMNDNLEDGVVNEEASSSMLNLDKDIDVNYDSGLWGSINDTKRDASEVKVEEFFLGFIKVDDTSGFGLFKRLEDEDVLVDLKLNINDIRGQSYDNSSNMKGKHQGVQKRKYVKGLSPKALLATCWESHIESVKAIRNQAPDFRDALIEIANSSKEDVVMAEAKGLCKNAFEDFEFLISLCIWYKILDKVNWASKELQKEEMNLEKAITNIKELILFFEKLREDGFQDLMEEGEKLAEDVGIDPVFAPKRVVRRKKQFDENVGEDANQSQSYLLPPHYRSSSYIT